MKTLALEMTLWARPNKYRLEGEDDFIVFAIQGDVKPYYDDAFKICTKHLELDYELPRDTVTPQIDSLKAKLEEEKNEHYATVRELEDRIQSLLALPAAY